MNRRGLIAMVHIARKDLALDEGTYRAVLERISGGRDSAADLTDEELSQVVDDFRRRGWKPKRSSGRSDKAYVRKVWAIWGAMHRDGIVHGEMRPGLRAFVKRMTGVGDPEWLDPAQSRTVIEALKQWRTRVEAERSAAKTKEG